MDPTQGFVHTLVAAISAGALALLGVDYYALLWGLIGAMFASSQSERLGRAKSIFLVVLSTLIGAALGNGVVAMLSPTSPRPFIVMMSLVAGFGAQAVLVAAVKAMITRIQLVVAGRTGDDSNG